MPRKKPTAVSTVLHRWMDRFRMTLGELSKATGFKASSLGQIARGARRPSDDMKIAIEAATQRWEAERGVAEPQGVRILDWYSPDEMSRHEKRRTARAAARSA